MTDKLNALITLRDKVKAGSIERYQSTLPLVRQWRSPLEYFEITDYIEAASNGSLDAAIALKDAVLPGWGYTVGHASATVFGLDENQNHTIGKHRVYEVSGYNPARAWLLAILEALIAIERNQSLVMRPKESE